MRIDVPGRRFGATEVLGPVAFEVPAGQTVAILGPSGIGKSTLLGLIAGLDRGPPDGHAAPRVEGAGRIGIVFQDPCLLPWRTAAENVVLAARVAPAEAERMLAAVGLAGRGGAYPRQLSLGQARRVALARALATRPDTLLMDEPFASLDAEAQARMEEVLQALLAERPGTRTLLVTHGADEAARLADRVIRLGGRPAAIVADETLDRPRGQRPAEWLSACARRIAAGA